MIQILCEDRCQADRIKARLDRDPDIRTIVFKVREGLRLYHTVATEASREIVIEYVPRAIRRGSVIRRVGE